MNYASFATNFKDEFREAYEDISMHQIGCLLDAGNYAEIGKLIWMRIDAAKESVEDDFPKERGDIEVYKEHRDLSE